NIGSHKERHRPRCLRREPARQSEKRAQSGGRGLGFPFIQIGFLFGNTDLPRRNSGQRKVAPAPKFRSGGTADARLGNGSAAFRNGESQLSDRLQRTFTWRANRLRLKEPAWFSRTGSLNAGQRFLDA